jgi:hypothetical protein
MGTKKLEQDLRDAGLRKKRARKVARAADRGRAGDRAARELVEQHSAAIRDSVSAVVSHAKPPRSSSAKATAKKSSAKRTSSKRAAARRKAPTRKAGSARDAAKRGRTTRTPRGRSTRRRSQSAR